MWSTLLRCSRRQRTKEVSGIKESVAGEECGVLHSDTQGDKGQRRSVVLKKQWQEKSVEYFTQILKETKDKGGQWY